MQLSEHFSLEELIQSQEATREGIDNRPPPEVLANLQKLCNAAEPIRKLLGFPMSVSSGFRCAELNTILRGARDSAHLEGWAMDFICPQFGTPLDICRKIVASGIKFDQLIQEGTWVHVSFAPPLRQQSLTAIFARNRPTSYTSGFAA